MVQQGVKYIHFVGDHGHRQGHDSLVKGWSYAAWDKGAIILLISYVSDINRCGHMKALAR